MDQQQISLQNNSVVYDDYLQEEVCNAKKKQTKRDIEKSYTTKQMVAKLRRLADCFEQSKRFQIQIAGERILVPADAEFNVKHERGKTMEEIEFQFKWKNKLWPKDFLLSKL